MKLCDFDYNLPKELIAQYPPRERDGSRMMVLDRKRKTVQHSRFRNIVSYLKRDDAIVFNDSKVIPARLICKRETGGKAEIFLLRRIRGNLYEALVRPSSKLFSGKKIVSEDGEVIAEIVKNNKIGRLVRFPKRIDIEKDLKKIGQIPLPPYIKRNPEDDDRERYQTVYARKDGSTAAPTAGLHFTKSILQRIKDRDVRSSYVTLHVSYGTFAPVKVEDIEDHRMYREFFELPQETQGLVKRAKEYGGRVIAVGTTTTRVLEGNAQLLLDGRFKRPYVKGWTDFYIYPPYKFKVVDALLTNFHLPKSTLLMLVSAFAGREFIMRAYREAIRERYRFYSYGDCMLIV